VLCCAPGGAARGYIKSVTGRCVCVCVFCVCVCVCVCVCALCVLCVCFVCAVLCAVRVCILCVCCACVFTLCVYVYTVCVCVYCVCVCALWRGGRQNANGAQPLAVAALKTHYYAARRNIHFEWTDITVVCVCSSEQFLHSCTSRDLQISDA